MRGVYPLSGLSDVVRLSGFVGLSSLGPSDKKFVSGDGRKVLVTPARGHRRRGALPGSHGADKSFIAGPSAPSPTCLKVGQCRLVDQLAAEQPEGGTEPAIVQMSVLVIVPSRPALIPCGRCMPCLSG